MEQTTKEKFYSSLFWSTCLGNLFEHYDTALFSFLSPFLAPLIFPDQEPLTALILTFAMIPLGMLARPLGSLFFGFIGDTYGRKQALFLTLVGMSVVSGAIALTPTYAQAGLLSPLLFCLGRILQNFLAAGESVGGAIYLLENSSEKRHDLLSSLFNASTIGGILLASAGVSLVSYYQLLDSGWRWLYLFGCATAFFGCMVRRQLDSSRLDQSPVKITRGFSNLGKIFWSYRRALLLIMVCSGFSYATYSIALVLMNGFIPLVSPITKIEMMGWNTSLLLLDFFALPFFGWLSSKTSREKVMLAAALSVVFAAVPLVQLLEGADLITVIIVRICFVIIGVSFSAPFYAWAQQLAPPSHRYAILSLGYALGSQLFGGPTAALSLWLFKKTGMITSISWYWLLLASASSLAIASTMFAKHKIQNRHTLPE
jgi:MFS family permease